MPSPASSPEIAAGNQPGGSPLSWDPEFRFVLAGCGVRTHATASSELSSVRDSTIDWERVLRIAEHHGVGPLVYQGLQGMRDVVPQPILDELRRRYESNARRNLVFVAELFRVLDCLEAHGIEAIPYKGPVLAEGMYGDLALREFSDLDVLIRPQNVSRAKQALKVLQYAPSLRLSPIEERAYIRSGYEFTFDGPLGKNLLEVQWAIVPHFFAVDFVLEEFFARSSHANLGGRKVRTLWPEDLLLALCVHAAKHAWTRLCWLRDIAAMTQQPLQWDLLFRRAREVGIQRILDISFLLASRLLGASVPEDTAAGLRGDGVAAELADEIAAHLSESDGYRTDSIEYFRLMLRSRERPSDRLRLVSRLALTPSVNEWQLVRLPEALFPFYRLVRMYRLASRFLGTSTKS
jgi:Uncharacterised nucleotidyltransferase